MPVISIEVPEDLKEQIDEDVDYPDESRSEWFRNAARNELGNQCKADAGA